jgi:hypothetical protein
MGGTLGRKNLGFFAAFVLVVSGCVSLRPYDPGPGKRVAAAFVQDSYLSGQPVNVTISNLSEVTLFYPGGFCKTALQRRDGTTWKTVLPAPTGCAITSAFLDPGQTIVHQYRLPNGVALGTYRLTMPMPVAEEDVAAQSELQTPAFQVYRASDQ